MNKINKIVKINDAGQIDYTSKLLEYVSRLEILRSDLYLFQDKLTQFLKDPIDNTYCIDSIIKYANKLQLTDVDTLLTKTFDAFNQKIEELGKKQEITKQEDLF